MAHRGSRGLRQQFDELLLSRGFNGEDVDQRDKLSAQREGCHQRISTTRLHQGQPSRKLGSIRGEQSDTHHAHVLDQVSCAGQALLASARSCLRMFCYIMSW